MQMMNEVVALGLDFDVGRSKRRCEHARTKNDVNGEISALCRAILEDSSNERNCGERARKVGRG
jgi:hypothetical protein